MDILDLADPANLSESDFEFRVGNVDDTSTWTPLASTPTISVRQGAGANGADRVSIILGDNDVVNQWLETKVLPTAQTGLPSEALFYYGNAISETGNSGADAVVDGQDFSDTAANPHTLSSLASITDKYDFNRDKLVNAIDLVIVRNQQAAAGSPLNLITVPSGGGNGQVAVGPAIDAPDGQTVGTEGTLTFSVVNGKGIEISQTESDAPLLVMLDALSGTLTLPPNTGLSVVDGTGTRHVMVTGTVSSVNTALNGLEFTPDADFVGTGSVTITASVAQPDGGSGLSASATIEIDVQPSPRIVSAHVNDGSAQRSMVRSIRLTFDKPVHADPAAFVVTQAGVGLVPTEVVFSSDRTVATLSFDGHSLANGVYDFNIGAASVVDDVGQSLRDDSRLNFHRLFGDTDGDGRVGRWEHRDWELGAIGLEPRQRL